MLPEWSRATGRSGASRLIGEHHEQARIGDPSLRRVRNGGCRPGYQSSNRFDRARLGILPRFQPLNLATNLLCDLLRQFLESCRIQHVPPEYALDVIFESAPYAEARWLSGAKPD